MALSPHVFDASAENFPRLVLENSAKGPVLVNYWSPHAGPCMLLMPRLVRLAAEFGGRFLLVMLNTDELGRLAREHGVNSLPTVKVYRHGQVIDTLRGAESEPVLRAFISKHAGNQADTLYVSALKAHHDGDTTRAVTLAAEAALAQPDNPRIPLDIAKLLVLQARHSEAHNLLSALPPALQDDAEISALLAHLDFLQAAQGATDRALLEQTVTEHPDDMEARYRLAAVSLIEDDYDNALQQLLEIARRDRGFRRDAGHKGLRAVLNMLPAEDARVLRYQEGLREILN
jgi:putative thioredoxin